MKNPFKRIAPKAGENINQSLPPSHYTAAFKCCIAWLMQNGYVSNSQYNRRFVVGVTISTEHLPSFTYSSIEGVIRKDFIGNTKLEPAIIEYAKHALKYSSKRTEFLKDFYLFIDYISK